jgi:hypothetical protein
LQTHTHATAAAASAAPHRRRLLVSGVPSAPTPPLPTHGNLRYAARARLAAVRWVDLWVDPALGDDGAAGTRAAPLRSLNEAWNRVPDARSARGYRINLKPVGVCLVGFVVVCCWQGVGVTFTSTRFF